MSSSICAIQRATAVSSSEKARVRNSKTMIEKAQASGSVRLFSVRHEFPAEWARFTSVKIDGTTRTAGLSLTLLPQHYPFWSQGIVGSGKTEVNTVKLFAKMLPTNKNLDLNLYDDADPAKSNIKIDALNQNPSLGNLLSGNLLNIEACFSIRR